MKTDLLNEPTKTGFLQTVGIALDNLKQQLQRDYERVYPELGEVIHLILDEEESRAWSLTSFPHLLLPDLVEAHVAKLNLDPVERKDAEVFATQRHHRVAEDECVYALCA